MRSAISRRVISVLAIPAAVVHAAYFSYTAAAAATTMPTLRVRKSSDRGYADHGWLKSYHTFSFASYYDPSFEKFGALRVINEDWVAGGEGFPPHPHSDYEIFSYLLSGSLEHKDSMGNREVLTRGDVQFTSAGRGIRHSEFNADRSVPVRFLQMWVKPHTNGLTPRYTTKRFTDESKTNTLRLLISKDGADGSIPINQDCSVYASLLEDGKTVEVALGAGPIAPAAATAAASASAGGGAAAGDAAVAAPAPATAAAAVDAATGAASAAAVASEFAASPPAITAASGSAKRRGYLHFPIMAGARSLTVTTIDAHAGVGASASATAAAAAAASAHSVVSKTLAPGDGLFIEGAQAISISAAADAGKAAEFVLFDLA